LLVGSKRLLVLALIGAALCLLVVGIRLQTIAFDDLDKSFWLPLLMILTKAILSCPCP